MDKIDSLHPALNQPEENVATQQDAETPSDEEYLKKWEQLVSVVEKSNEGLRTENASWKESLLSFSDFYLEQINPIITELRQTLSDESVNLSPASSTKPVRIQVAHNSFSFNNHVKLLNYLEHFKDRDIELIVPMTYGVSGINGSFGGREYINVVSAYAKKLFGNKVTIMTENMPFEEYVKFLWTVDIAVFDFDRPCGLGNIRILLYMGKKIFLPSGNKFYDFLNEKGIKVYDTKSIKDLSYNDFITPPVDNDLSWIKSYLNNDDAIAHWKKMFEELENERKY